MKKLKLLTFPARASMDEFSNHLKEVGYSFSDGPTQSSSGSVFAFVDAPEGYEVEVIEKPGNS